MAGMFRGIGRRLMGALSITGGFKTHEAEAISEKLEGIEARHREGALAPAAVAPIEYQLNRAEKSAARRRNRFRSTRNAAFVTKRAGYAAQPRLSHEQASSKGFQFIYNPTLSGLLWASGAMAAYHANPPAWIRSAKAPEAGA